MFKKIYEKIIKFIKEEYKFLIILLIFYLVISYPLDIFITSGGGIINIDDKVIVENGYQQEGEFNLSYVREYKGNVLTYLLSYVMPNWERESLEDYRYDEESYEEMFQRSLIDLELANASSIKNAYEEAGIDLEVKDKKTIVYFYDKEINNNFKIGDELVKIDNKPIEEFHNNENFFEDYEVDQTIKIDIIRDEKEKTIEATIQELNGKKILGLFLYEIEEFITDPKVEFNFANDEGGPSGGLLTTLYLYNQLTEEDITQGLKIAGSGEILPDGSAGEIGGVNHKIIGAAKKDIDIFIAVNGDNYDLAKKTIEEENLDIKLIGVDNLNDAINQLKNINN